MKRKTKENTDPEICPDCKKKYKYMPSGDCACYLERTQVYTAKDFYPDREVKK